MNRFGELFESRPICGRQRHKQETVARAWILLPLAHIVGTGTTEGCHSVTLAEKCLHNGTSESSATAAHQSDVSFVHNCSTE